MTIRGRAPRLWMRAWAVVAAVGIWTAGMQFVAHADYADPVQRSAAGVVVAALGTLLAPALMVASAKAQSAVVMLRSWRRAGSVWPSR